MDECKIWPFSFYFDLKKTTLNSIPKNTYTKPALEFQTTFGRQVSAEQKDATGRQKNYILSTKMQVKYQKIPIYDEPPYLGKIIPHYIQMTIIFL